MSAIQFSSPSQRAVGTDLTISVSPLGLVELADEEFEVHGPRLNRYSQNWAFYLGHHFAYRREPGEPQFAFNYVKALSDFITNFTFSQGVFFRSVPQYAHIIPALLKRVWETDNVKEAILWELGQQGSISGDVFVKVAYENQFQDEAGGFHPGRVRVLPLNPAHCFPEWHPHDRDRMVRFKLKYRFWGTAPEGTRQVFTYTEIMTDSVIEEYVNDELIDSRPNPLGTIPVVHVPNIRVSSSPWGSSDVQDVIPLNREYNEKALEVSDIINYHCVDEDTEVLTTSGWKKQDEVTDGDTVLTRNPTSDAIEWQSATFNRFDYSGNLVRWDNRIDALSTPGHRWLAEARVGRNRNFVREMATTKEPRNGERSVAQMQQGSRVVVGGGTPATFPTDAKYKDELVDLVGWWITEGWYGLQGTSVRPVSILSQSESHNPDLVADIRRLGVYWNSEGATFTEQRKRDGGVVCWYLGTDLTELLLSVAPAKGLTPEFIGSLTYRQAERLFEVLISADGTRVGDRERWYQDDSNRRDGFQMLAALLGKRTRSFDTSVGHGVVDIYTNDTILVEHTIERATEEFYTGTVWCPTVDNGVWFARRNGVTYWTGNSAPVTIMTGAKMSNLERGANKVWAIPSEKAQVFNLEGGTAAVGPAMEYMERIKLAMHEMTGVPSNALGELQPISNTSGVALAITYQPMMQRYHMKQLTYGEGFQKINALVLRTLFMAEPNSVMFDPDTQGMPEEGQPMIINPADPLAYQTFVHWPPPLPIDKLVVLNEIQVQMALGLESKRGALKRLGEEFPDEKAEEIFKELQQDARDSGALDLYNAQVQAAIIAMTGIVPGPGDDNGQPASVAGEESGADSGGPLPGVLPPSPEQTNIQNQLATLAFGTKLAQRRTPDND